MKALLNLFYKRKNKVKFDDLPLGKVPNARVATKEQQGKVIAPDEARFYQDVKDYEYLGYKEEATIYTSATGTILGVVIYTNFFLDKIMAKKSKFDKPHAYSGAQPYLLSGYKLKYRLVDGDTPDKEFEAKIRSCRSQGMFPQTMAWLVFCDSPQDGEIIFSVPLADFKRFEQGEEVDGGGGATHTINTIKIKLIK